MPSDNKLQVRFGTQRALYEQIFETGGAHDETVDEPGLPAVDERENANNNSNWLWRCLPSQYKLYRKLGRGFYVLNPELPRDVNRTPIVAQPLFVHNSVDTIIAIVVIAVIAVVPSASTL